jgi:BirA family biotin operon repressor/biotin-[acetyl-CoA-carboxylase] ligase
MKDCKETWRQDTKHIGRTVYLFDSLESTNALGLGLPAGEIEDGMVLLARAQSAGRGQHDRTWVSPPGTSVLMSVVLLPPPALRRAALLTAWAAVGVCEAIEKLIGLRATIKWPNDVLIDGKKVCGILIEQKQATVAGIGLNVLQSRQHFLDAGLPEATSLYASSSLTPTPLAATASLCDALDLHYQSLLKGQYLPLEEAWRERLGLTGRAVQAETHEGTVTGRLVELGFDGVVLKLPDGSNRAWLPEAIRHLSACGA